MMRPVAVVDGSNVALEEKTKDGRGKVENITRMRHQLEDQGYRAVIIADASLKHHVDDKTQYEHLEDEGIIHQAPAGTQADYFVLVTAQREDAIVISNDRFDTWQDQFPWVKERRVPFMIVDGIIEMHCPTAEERRHAGHRSRRDHAEA